MNLIAAERRMRSLMAEHGLRFWSFDWDRAVKRRGQTDYTNRHITMSRALTEIASEEEAEQTMLHEIAHALVGVGHGHGSVWLRQARAIGFKGERTSARENEVAPTLIGTCPNGHTTKRFRRPRRAVSCGRCSRSFDEAYLITWERANHSA